MKLIELISRIKTIEAAEVVLQAELPDTEFDLADIFVQGELDLNSEVKFFNAEEIPGTMVFENDGVKYTNVFPLNMLQEMVEAYASDGLTNDEAGRRILDYRLKDA